MRLFKDGDRRECIQVHCFFFFFLRFTDRSTAFSSYTGKGRPGPEGVEVFVFLRKRTSTPKRVHRLTMSGQVFYSSSVPWCMSIPSPRSQVQ